MTISLTHGLARKTAILFAGNLVSQVMTGFAALLLARQSGAAEFGIVGIALAVGAIFCDLVDMGTSTGMSRAVASGETPKLVAGHTILGKAAMVAPIGALVTAGLLAFSVPRAFALLPTYVVLWISTTTALGCLRSLDRYALAAILPVMERLVLVFSFLLLLHERSISGSTAFIGSMCLGLFFSALAGVGFLLAGNLRSASLVRGSASAARSFSLRFGHLGLGSLATDLNVLDTPIVALSGGLAVAGEYATASRFTGPLGMPASALTGTLMPRFARAGSADEAWFILLRSRPLLVLAATPLIIFAMVADAFVSVVLGPGYGPSTVWCLRIMAGSACIATVNQVLYAFCQARHAEKTAAVVIVPGMLFGLALGYLGAKLFGAVGAAGGAAIAQGAIFVGLLLVSKRRRKDLPVANRDSIPQPV